MTASLTAMDRTARLARVREAMEVQGCDALVVTKAVNVRWLSGFTGSAATAIVTADAFTIITDDRYATQIGEQLAEAQVTAEVAVNREIAEPLKAAVGSAGRVGLEADDVSWSLQRRLTGWLEGRELLPTSQLIETERRIKDEGELDRLRRAAAIADVALEETKAALAERPTERAMANLLEQAMVRHGSEEVSFPTIVAAGPNSAKPHHRPGDRVIEAGDSVIIDFGAKVDGYGSDMTRTFLVGDVDGEARERFDAVIEAQAVGVAAVRHGVEAEEVDRTCRGHLAERGLAEAFTHGTGHGLGLEIHENPILSSRATGILRSGYVVTVEPGVYLPGVGGVRIEDSVVVTDSGAETITLATKSPAPDHRRS